MNMHASIEPPRAQSSYYWAPISRTEDQDDISPALIRAVERRGDRQEFQFFVAEAFVFQESDAGDWDCAPNGLFQVAVTPGGEACGLIYYFFGRTTDEGETEWEEVNEGPAWASARPGDAAHAFEQVYRQLQDEGHL